jgi:hypothetical protein
MGGGLKVNCFRNAKEFKYSVLHYVYVCILDIYPTQIVGLEMISEWKRSTLCVLFFLSI